MDQVIQVGGHLLQITIVLTFPSALRQIKDNGNMLYGRINAQGYEECQEGIQAVSGIAGDIQDAVLDYQVGDHHAHAAALSLKFGCFGRWPNNKRYLNRIVN